MEVVNESGEAVPEFKMLEKYSKVLDSSIKIPGTEKSIGIDPIIGLIPVVGDLAGYAFSVMLIYYSIKHGASKRVLMKMLGNTALDATIGIIPIVGTIFDFAYKANERNLKLFKEYHEEGMHRESTLPLFIGAVSVFFVIILAVAYLGFYLLSSLVEMIF